MIRIKHPLCFTEIGLKDKQEDSLFPNINQATDQTPVFLVCDGMGGHEHGEVASRCVADTIGKLTTAKAPCRAEEMKVFFNNALEQAYSVLDENDQPGSARTMGTTLTFMARCTDGVLLAHIGDSRIYQLRPGSGILFHTRDHSLVNDLVASGEITEEEARTHPRRNVITRAVMPCHGDETEMVSATFRVVTDIRPGDIFFICCDGVIEKIDDCKLEEILLAPVSHEQRVETLRQTCLDLNTRDNNTCYYIEIEGDANLSAIETETVHTDKDNNVELTPVNSKNIGFVKYIIYTLIGAIICGLAMYFILSSSSHDNKNNTYTNGIIKRTK